MNKFLPRFIEEKLNFLISRYPAIVLVGPRQVGKTSLIKHLATSLKKTTQYLDLELPEDLNKLNNPTLFLETVEEQTIIIDEIQRKPDLFPILRAVIDKNRQAGRFILLGSASPELIRDTSESLAGRVAYLELSPFILSELSPNIGFKEHWLKGGFPESVLTADYTDSFDWRINFIQSYLERDLPLLGLKADPSLIRRLWTMLAHVNGQLLNMESLSKSLAISSPTVKRYLDFMESAYLIRRLSPYHFNIKKRLVKTPKIFIRDTGILHALLNISNLSQLLGHPIVGHSWEAYILQEIAARLPARTELFFYRTQAGTEADIVLAPGGIPKTVVEIKFSTTPKLSRGFHQAAQDLETKIGYIICPIEEGYPLSEEITVLSYKKLDQLFE